MPVEIKKCRICDSRLLKQIIDLGFQPPANSLHKKKQVIKKFPLKLLFCVNCKTAQLSIALNPDDLFKKYFWVTGTSIAAKNYSNFFYKRISKYLEKKSMIYEIASNDGTFLKPFIKNGHEVLGIDPAKNIVRVANKNKIRTLPYFFSEKIVGKIKKNYKKPKIIFARNVIPHVKNIKSVVNGISKLADEETIVAIEFHYSKDILTELQYDSIYHEHVFYFTIKTISDLFVKYRLKSFDCFDSPISGGSKVLLFSKKNKGTSSYLNSLIKKENLKKINQLNTWTKFGKKSFDHAQNFKKQILKLAKNSKLFGYGASARSSTLLNFCNITSKEIDFIVDQNPLKQGFYTPGTNIPIVSMIDAKKNFLKMNMVLLAWNFKDEILNLMKKNYFKNKIVLPLEKK